MLHTSASEGVHLSKVSYELQWRCQRDQQLQRAECIDEPLMSRKAAGPSWCHLCCPHYCRHLLYTPDIVSARSPGVAQHRWLSRLCMTLEWGERRAAQGSTVSDGLRGSQPAFIAECRDSSSRRWPLLRGSPGGGTRTARAARGLPVWRDEQTK